MTQADPDRFDLLYGPLEALLAELCGASGESIRVRFRKIRSRPFPDDIRTGSGSRVRYDLRRALSLAAVFQVNTALVPQGHAIAMVTQTWPEWCRASIAAAAELGVIRRPFWMQEAAGPVIAVSPDAFGGEGGAFAATIGDGGPSARPGSAPCVVVDMREAVRLLAGAGAADKDALPAAFAELDRTFGWSPVDLPHDAQVASIPTGVSFLDEGPYFDRARTLATATLERGAPWSRARLQTLADYLADPAPVDQWKAAVGVDRHEPRLWIYLARCAGDLGLVSHIPETIRATTGEDAARIALGMIAAAEARGRPGR